MDNCSKLNFEDQKKLQANSKIIYYANFAFEDYLDNNPSKNNDAINDILKRIGVFWKLKQTARECELLSISNNLVTDIEKIYNLLGRENFKFYDDGVVEYIWNKS